MKDKLANLDIQKGCQEADGSTALGYARSRHTSSIGDIARAQHQREVVSAVGRKALSPWSVLNPVRYWHLDMAAPDSFAFGEGTGPSGRPLGLGDDPRERRERPDLRRPDRRPGRELGRAALRADVHASSRRTAPTTSRESLCTPSGLPRGITG